MHYVWSMNRGLETNPWLDHLGLSCVVSFHLRFQELSIRRLLHVAKKINLAVILAAAAFYLGLNHGEVLSIFGPSNTNPNCSSYNSRSKEWQASLTCKILSLFNFINNCKHCIRRQKNPHHQSKDCRALAKSLKNHLIQWHHNVPCHSTNRTIAKALFIKSQILSCKILSVVLCNFINNCKYYPAKKSSSSIKGPSYTQASTESMSSQCPMPFHQSYYRRSSQESNDSMSSQSLTPFHPMLPRELLLPFKFPAVPFPTLPADATSTAVHGKFGGIYPPQA